MTRDSKLLGWILTDGTRYWTGDRWRKHGRELPAVLATQQEALDLLAKLKRKRWDVSGVNPLPIRCP